MSKRSAPVMFCVAAALMTVVAACGGSDATATPAATATQARPTATPVATIGPTATPVPTRPPATPTPSGPQPRYGGTLQARMYNDIVNWDTYHAAGGFSTLIVQQMNSNLIAYQKDNISKIVGDTALSWDLGADGKTYTFRLRKDVTWHDGKPFTAADVVYSLKRASDPRFVFNRERAQLVQEVTAPDPATVVVTLQRPSNVFIANLAGPFMLMYPSHITNMAEWQKNPIGTGAFVSKGIVAATKYTFEKNPKYYNKDANGNALPFLDGIVYTVILDKAFALAAFRSGNISCGCGFDGDFLTANQETLVKEIPGVKLALVFGGIHQLDFNMQRPPFNNKAFRQAVAIGFDKDKVAGLHNLGKNYWPMPPLIPPEKGGQWGLPKADLTKLPGYNPNHDVDLKLAQDKFKESGIDPKSVTVEVMFTAFFGPEGELIATVLGELGMKATANLVQTAEQTKKFTDGTYTVGLLTPSPTTDDPGDQYIGIVTTGGSQNYRKWSNPRVDQLLKDQDGELDAAKRRQMMWEVQRAQLDDFPTMPFLWQGVVYGTRPEMFGYAYNRPLSVTTGLRLDEAWLAK